MVPSHEPSPDQADEADVIQQQVRQSRQDAKRAEARRVRLRAKEARKRTRRNQKRREEKQAAKAKDSELGKAPRAAVRSEASAPRKRGRPKKAAAEELQVDSGPAPVTPPEVRDPAALASEVPASRKLVAQPPAARLVVPGGVDADGRPDEAEFAAPERPQLGELPATPLESLPALSEPTESSRIVDESLPEFSSAGPPPPKCVTAFAALFRHIVQELPAQSSARRGAIGQVAKRLAVQLTPSDLNVFLREVQLGLLDKGGISRSKSTVLSARSWKKHQEKAEGRLKAVLRLEDNEKPNPVQVLWTSMSSRSPPTTTSGLQHENFRRCLKEVVQVATTASDWEVAWQCMDLASLPDEEQNDATLLLAITLLTAAIQNGEGQHTRALADFVRSHKIKLRILESAVLEAVGRIPVEVPLPPRLPQVLASLLAYLYPAPIRTTGYGWFRPGWKFNDWMISVEKVLGSLKEMEALALLDETSALVKASDSLSNKELEDFLEKAKLECAPMPGTQIVSAESPP